MLKYFFRSDLVKYSAIAIVIILVIIGSFFLGWRLTLSNLTIKSITATQAANAMKNDNFYGSYDFNTLEIHGQITTVTKQNDDLIIGLVTHSTFKTLCDLGNTTSNLQKGDKVTVIAEGARAERQTSAVLLKDCIELPI